MPTWGGAYVATCVKYSYHCHKATSVVYHSNAENLLRRWYQDWLRISKKQTFFGVMGIQLLQLECTSGQCHIIWLHFDADFLHPGSLGHGIVHLGTLGYMPEWVQVNWDHPGVVIMTYKSHSCKNIFTPNSLQESWLSYLYTHLFPFFYWCVCRHR